MILLTLFLLYLLVICKATSCSWSTTTFNAANYDADFQAHVPAFMAKHGCKALVTYQSNVHLKGHKRHTLQAVCPKGLKAISGGCATNNACDLMDLPYPLFITICSFYMLLYTRESDDCYALDCVCELLNIYTFSFYDLYTKYKNNLLSTHTHTHIIGK